MVRGTALLAIALVLVTVLTPLVLSEGETYNAAYIRELISGLDFAAIEEHARYLATLGSRVPGYPGYYKAFEYVKGQLEKLGLKVEVQEFEVVVPVEEEVYLEVGGERIPAHIIWPNGMIMVSPTPPEGIRGRLVYGGFGSLEEFDGKEVEGSIVVLEFNSLDSWLTAADLGARAVVFLEPKSSNRYEALSKFVLAPIKFTRVYVAGKYADEVRELAKRGAEARLVVRASLARVKAYNVVAFVNGTDRPSDVIVVATHFDTWSVVPAIAPGAREALGVAYLLELARLLAEHPPKRSVWIAALSGHWQALAGAKAFVRRYFHSDSVARGKLRTWALIGVQITDESPIVSALRIGHCLRFGVDNSQLVGKYTWISQRLSTYLGDPRVLRVISEKTGVEVKGYQDVFHDDLLDASGWWGTQQAPYMLDSEPAALAGTPSFSFRTGYAHDFKWGIPVNTFEEIDFRNVRLQIATVTALIGGLSSETAWQLSWESCSPVRFAVRVGVIEGYVLLRGEVAEADPSIGWYRPIAGAVVRVFPEGPAGGCAWPFSIYVTMTNESGKFEAIIGPRGTTPAWLYDAWVIDEEGNVELATDRGPLYGQGITKPSSSPLAPVEEVIIPLFKARSITLYKLFSPNNMRRPVINDPRVPSQYQLLSESYSLEVYDLNVKGEPYFYGYSYYPWEYAAVVFVQPRSRSIIALRVEGGWPEVLVLNATAEEPEGRGFYAIRDVVVRRATYAIARDMYYLVKSRYEGLSSRGVRSLSLEHCLEVGEKLLKEAEEAFSRRKYSEGYRKSLIALAYLSKAYKNELMPLYDDTGKTSLVLFAVIVPSVIFLERLLFHFEDGKRRLVALVAIGAALVGVFYLIHPALSLMSNVFMSLMGILLALLFGIAVMVLGGETRRIIEETAERLLGKHRVERETVMAMVMAVPIALENMRRRPLRTALTLVTIIAIVVALTSLTSVSYYTDVKFTSVGPAPPVEYKLMVKRGYGVPPYDVLDKPLYDYLKGLVGGLGEVRVRAWYYPVTGLRIGYSAPIFSERGRARAAALLGITYEELVEMLGEAIVKTEPGLEDAFRRGEPVCLISVNMSRSLGVKPGDDITFLGVRFRVVGLVNAALADRLRDIDGTTTTPIRPEHNPVLALQPPGPPPSVPFGVSYDELVIAPLKAVLEMGGYVALLTIKLKPGVEPSEVVRLAREITLGTDLQAYVVSKGVVVQGARVPAYMFLGWEMIPIVLAISALNITMTLLGSIKERMRDVYVFMAVGLSPMGSALMFITETLAYAVVAITIGYVAGFLANRLFIDLGVLPSTFVFNSASIFIAIAFVVVILACLLSAAYPSYVAARMITPSLERRWKPPTKPKGDIWELPIPARIPSKAEAQGILEFLYEYYTGMGKEKRYFVVREIEPPDHEALVLRFKVALAPFEMNVIQQAEIAVLADEIRRIYALTLRLKRLSGLRDLWVANNYYFIDDLRKQLLLWRSLSVEEHRRYEERAKRRLKRQ